MWFTHAFDAPIERHAVGRGRAIRYTVVFLPEDMAADLPFDRHPRLRIEGEVADVPVKGAFQSSGDGRYYLMISPETLKAASIDIDHVVTVRFRIADQDAIDVPPALESALGGDAEAEAAWAALTVGRRRAFAHHVASAKTPATRDKRVEAVLAAITGRDPPDHLIEDVRRLGWLLGRR